MRGLPLLRPSRSKVCPVSNLGVLQCLRKRTCFTVSTGKCWSFHAHTCVGGSIWEAHNHCETPCIEVSRVILHLRSLHILWTPWTAFRGGGRAWTWTRMTTMMRIQMSVATSANTAGASPATATVLLPPPPPPPPYHHHPRRLLLHPHHRHRPPLLPVLTFHRPNRRRLFFTPRVSYTCSQAGWVVLATMDRA